MSNEMIPFLPTNLEQALRLSEVLAKSSLLPESLRGKPNDVLVTLITGHELGLSPMQAIRGMHVVKGKAVMSADLTVALVKKHAACAYFKLVESTDALARYETDRKDEGKTTLSFTIEQASKAGLTGGDNWRKYPAAMLRARCAAALARAVYPDVTTGVYDPDEAQEFGGPAAPPPVQVERDITPAVEAVVESAAFEVVDVPKVQTQTERVKEMLREKIGFIDAPLTLTPWAKLELMAKQHSMDFKRVCSILKDATKKTKKADVTEADVALVQARIEAINGHMPAFVTEDNEPQENDEPGSRG